MQRMVRVTAVKPLRPLTTIVPGTLHSTPESLDVSFQRSSLTEAGKYWFQSR